jgi:predicted Zn-dependent protease
MVMPKPRSATTRRAMAFGVALTIGLGAPIRAPLAQVHLPALGESAAEDISLGAERRLGDQIMRDIRRDPDYLDDPVLLDYLNSIWQPLVAAAKSRGDIDPGTDGQFAWEAFLVRDRSVNAFALPGGFVGVHLGLIAMTASADELASVLAHELTHVTQRHIARSIGNSQKASLVGLGALILGILAASRSNNADMAQAAIVGGQAAALQGQLNFSRDMEREADRIGFGVLGAAGFSPSGMAAMFEKLDLANRLNDNGSFPYLRSHPLTVERISEARSRVMIASPSRSSPSLHRVMQARARVLMDGSVDWVRRQLEVPAGATPSLDRVSALYASALSATVLRDHSRARERIAEAQRLSTTLPEGRGDVQRALDLLEAQAQITRGEPALGLATLGRIGPEPETRAQLLLRAEAALALHRLAGDGSSAAVLRASVESLQSWVALRPHDAAAWTSLSVGAEALGMKLRSLRAQAEQRAALGDIAGAIDRLRVGRTASRTASGQDFIEASIIDARLRQLEGLRRQLAADARRGPNDESQPPR